MIHFITGSTGFLGSYLCLELLRRKEQNIYCLVRGRKDLSSQQRLKDILLQTARLYGFPQEVVQRIDTNCIAVNGNLDSCSTLVLGNVEIDQLWHCAASLRYEDNSRAEIFATNVEGTKNLLTFAKHHKVRMFNHFSTAYVAGKRQGIILEEPCISKSWNNAYEESKAMAEYLVWSETFCKKRVLRPTVIVGHSQTYSAINFSGVYGFYRKLIKASRMFRKKTDTIDSLPLLVACQPDVELNLVPIDHVVKMAVSLCKNEASEGIYHLSNKRAGTVGDVCQIASKRAGIPITTEKSQQELTPIDRRFTRSTAFYLDYFQTNKLFDKSQVDKYLSEPLDFPIDKEVLNGLFSYCDNAQAAIKPHQ